MKLSSHKAERSKGIELQMTSMIDVVFLLLIFFITTSTFVKTEQQLTSAIKTNKKSRAQPTDFEPAVIQIVEGAGNRFVYRVGGRDIQSAEELSRVMGQFPLATKTEGAYVRVSDDAPFNMAAVALEACREARFIAVSYVPLRSSD